MTCIYSISVLGNLMRNNLEIQPVFYKIYFYIIRRYHKYEIWFQALELTILCTIFTTEKEALTYLHRSIKASMHNKFLFRVCFNCDTKNYFPANNCINCGLTIYPADFWEIEEIVK